MLNSYRTETWIKILLLAIISWPLCTPVVLPEGGAHKPKSELIYNHGCDHSNRNLLIASLMNGEVRAVDLDTGQTLWNVRTGSKLLSSSISNLEVIYNGIPTRLVPSLDGSLFRFRDDSFEPLPFTAETLLSSSFKLSGDSTVVGSKELRTIGLIPTCGQVLYKCDKEGCESNQKQDLPVDDVLVIKHLTHTVRAASLRTGAEKWNFSVGHHELSFSKSDVPLYAGGAEDSCDSSSSTCNGGTPKLKFVVPDGMVVMLDPAVSSHVLWEHQFDIPISKCWMLRNGRLESVDLLDPRHLMLSKTITDADSNTDPEVNVPPSLYIGLYEKQVYIQPSEKLRKNVSAIANFYQRHAKLFTALPRVRWAPYITSNPSRTPWLNYGKPDPTRVPPTTISKPQDNALSLFHSTMDYPYDQGFYLTAELTEDDGRPRVDSVVQPHDEDGMLDDLEDIMFVQIASLRYHWREVVVISLLSAVILNLILYLTRVHRRRLKNKLKCFGTDGEISEVSDVSDDERAKNKPRKAAVIESEPIPPPPIPQYHSRYQTDFVHIQCLGKGGFGVVFHARNAIDECDYAIKRICLPNSDDAKEKVTREVKALAKLEHPNIVRYFQSWFETPPAGWQEDRDKIWESTERFVPTPVNSAYPLSRVTSQVAPATVAAEGDTQFFIPKLRLEDSKDQSESFGYRLNNRIDDSLDIVFASGGGNDGETSVPVNQPFHKYALAPAERSDSNQSESDSEWDQLEDSGYHKNRMALIESTGSFGNGDGPRENEAPRIISHKRPVLSKSSKSAHNQSEPQAKLFLYIQMQLCKRETLRDYLNANTLYRDKDDILLIFRQICDAVEYIHSQGLIHRDLKPTNIFFSAENTIKVGDFGLVTALSAFPDKDSVEDAVVEPNSIQLLNLTNNVGTQIYMSPEQIAGRQYNSKVDIYALGLVFFELKYPFSTMMERVLTLQAIKKHKYPERFPRELPREYKFVKWMLSRSASKRPSITEVLQSEVMLGSDRLLRADRTKRARTVSSRSSSSD